MPDVNGILFLQFGYEALCRNKIIPVEISFSYSFITLIIKYSQWVCGTLPTRM